MTPSIYNTTPAGAGPWQVPLDPCDAGESGGTIEGAYENCAYWGAEKRPDIWVNALWKYGAPNGEAWDLEADALNAGYPVDHSPQPGDLAIWPPNGTMGTDSNGNTDLAGSPGHVAYVDSVNSDGTITISETGASSAGGLTVTLTYDPTDTWFIHQLPPQTLPVKSITTASKQTVSSLRSTAKTRSSLSSATKTRSSSSKPRAKKP